MTHNEKTPPGAAYWLASGGVCFTLFAYSFIFSE